MHRASLIAAVTREPFHPAVTKTETLWLLVLEWLSHSAMMTLLSVTAEVFDILVVWNGSSL